MFYLKIAQDDNSTKFWINLYTQALEESKDKAAPGRTILSQINHHLSCYDGFYSPSRNGRFIAFNAEEAATAFKLRWNY